MANFGVRLAYPLPDRVVARQRQTRSVSVTGARLGTRPAFARVAGALRRLARGFVDAQVRVAGPPWDGPRLLPGAYATAGRPPREAATTGE